MDDQVTSAPWRVGVVTGVVAGFAFGLVQVLGFDEPAADAAVSGLVFAVFFGAMTWFTTRRRQIRLQRHDGTPRA